MPAEVRRGKWELGMKHQVRRSRLACWLVTTSMAALAAGSQTPAYGACVAVTASFTNPSAATIPCITMSDVSTFSVAIAISNAGTINAGGITLTNTAELNALITVTNAGIISAGGVTLTNASISQINIYGGVFASGGALGVSIDSNSRVGSFGFPVLIDGSGSSVASTGTFAGGISNAGAIYSINGIAVFVEGMSTFSGGIVNSSSGVIVAGEKGIFLSGDNGFSGGITNAGHLMDAANATGISLSDVVSFSGGIVNAAGGTIGMNLAGILVDIGSTFSGGITNSGVITGNDFGHQNATLDGIEVGDISQFSGGIANSSGALIFANTGILLRGNGTGNGRFPFATFAGGIVNSGTISANNVGVEIGSVQTFTGGISNSGTISAGVVGLYIGTTATLIAGVTAGVTAGGSGIATFAGGVSNVGTIQGGVGGILINGIPTFTGGIANGSGGLVSAAGVAIDINGVAVFAGGINNAGTVSSGGTGILVGGGTASFAGGIANTGTVSAGQLGIAVSGVSNFADGVANSGTIGAGIGGILVTSVSSFAGGIANSGGGTIDAPGFGVDVNTVSQFSGGISNAGVISVAGNTGIIVGGAVSTFTGGIANTGTVRAGEDGIAVASVVTFAGGVSNGGSISAGNSAIIVDTVSVFSGGITNSGMISALGSIGIAVAAVSAFSGGVSNAGGGTIAGQSGILLAGVSTFAGGISNSGAITAGRTGIAAGDIASFADGISNGGTVAAGQRGILLASVSTFAGGIKNSGAITAGQTGIAAGNVASLAGGISNSGTVSAGAAGIRLAQVAAVSGGISNSGTIVGQTGIVIVGGSSFTGAVVNTGAISGFGGTAIDASAAGPAIAIDQQAGGILGAVRLSANGSFNMSGGTVVGSIIGQGGGSANFMLGSGTQVFGAGTAITGLAALNLSSGLLVLDDAHNSVGAAAVSGGVLQVGDASHAGAMLAASTLTLGTGGTLAGYGTVAGNVGIGAGATLLPGGSIGTLTINGNLTFGPGSVYLVEVTPTTADKTVVTGAANLSGTVQAWFAPGKYGSQSYTILTASGVTGAFAGISSNFVTNSIFLAPTLIYKPAEVDLAVVQQGFASAAVSANQTGVAGALDTLPATSSLFKALFGIGSAAQAQQAFDALSGEIHADVETTLIEDSWVMRQALLGRLRQASYAPSSASLGALAFSGLDVATTGTPAMGDITYWSQALGGVRQGASDGNAADLKQSGAGFVSGFDARFGDWGRAGLAAGYSNSSVNVQARASSAGIETAELGAYAGTSVGPVSLRGGAAYSWSSIDTNRLISIPGFFDHTAASRDGSTAQLFGEAGYGLALGPVAAEPFAGLAWVHVATASFAETGGAAALSGAAGTADVGYGWLGARFATSVALADGAMLIPRASVAWQHALADPAPAASLTLQATGASFTVFGVPIARDQAVIEGGFDLRLSPSLKLGLSYVGELARGAQDHSAKGSFTWNW
jgi:outer membrane autotransporter protein